jgi:methionyl-tRNA formyltransferase
VVIAFGQKLSPELLEGVFAVNLHGSLLPQYRGAAPIQRAVMDGRASTGVSVIALAQRMDAGVVYAMRTRAIGATETSDDVHDELALLGPEVIQEVLFKYEARTLEGVVQDEGLATRARKLSKAESSFDVALLTAHEARARINGLNSWPGFSAMLGELSVKILRVQEVSSEGTAAVGILGEDGRIRTSAGAIEVLSIQPLGSKPMTFAEFARGRRSYIGLPVLPLKQQ